jgi:hypothetical protein
LLKRPRRSATGSDRTGGSWRVRSARASRPSRSLLRAHGLAGARSARS